MVNSSRARRRFRVIKARGVKLVNNIANSDMLTLAVSDLKSMVFGSITETTLVMCFCVSMWLQYTHSSSKTTITDYLTLHSPKSFSDWAVKNIERVIGFSSFLPVFASAPAKIRTQLLLFTGCALWVIPVLTQFEYMFCATALFVYCKCRRKSTRMILVFALVAYAYFVDKGGFLARITKDVSDGKVKRDVSSDDPSASDIPIKEIWFGRESGKQKPPPTSHLS